MHISRGGPAIRYVIASTVLAVMLVGSVVLNLFIAQHVVNASQAQWCGVLELLTAKAPPASNRGQTVFYEKLRTLELRFHC